MPKPDTTFQTVTVSGAMLPVDILRKIVARDKEIEGLAPDSYHLPDGTKISEAITQSWAVVQAHWKAFSAARELLSDDETGTSVTNEKWLLPLFKELEYGRLTTTEAPEIEEKTYSIRRFYNHSPIHLIGCNLPLDRRTKRAVGAATASPHSMIQEFLNRSDDHLWAFLSNGLQLRILRDNVSLSRQAYVEFDLEAMMDGEVYSDFALLWMLCHQSRVEAEKQEDCWLEAWSKVAREAGTRILNDLRKGVADAIEALGRGFIGHPRNDRLREKLQESGDLSKDDYYRQLLRIVYRLLFLFVAEDRGLLHPTDADASACELYDKHYSSRRLREMSEKLRGSKHSDLWHSLSLVFDRLGKPDGCSELGLIGLGSFLWSNSSTEDLLGPSQIPPLPQGEVAVSAAGEGSSVAVTQPSEPVLITNDDLLTAIRALAFVEQDRVLRPVDYRNLGSEELGSVYESLLELHPVMHVEAKSFDLSTAAGNERKTTGSYYTPDSLVQCLLDSALDPVVADRLKGKKGEQAEQAILETKVCDPACGSGHFLIAAAHRLARHLARIRTGETEASPADYQRALRDIIGRCIYGVDINPMAVELCKVSLWMEAIDPGRPLTFLDHHIQCGNSLLGTTPALLTDGIPDNAFKPIEGDVKAVASELKKRNKQERNDYETGQGQFDFDSSLDLGNLPASFAHLSSSDDESVAAVAEKERRYAELVSGDDYQNARLLADTWCAAFVWKKDSSDLGRACPTENDFRRIENTPHSILPHVRSEVRRLSRQYQFFHWHLAFPDVFVLPEEAGKAENEQTGWSRGFDVVLGNPPWERIKIQEKEWFGQRSPEIANAKNASSRRRLIAELAESEPRLFEEFKGDCRVSEAQGHLLRTSGRYPLCGRGDINTYTIFSELNDSVANLAGRAGFIVPSGIATDDTTKYFFQHLVNSQILVSLFDFRNKGFFGDVAGAQGNRFALVTLTGINTPSKTMRFMFRGETIGELSDAQRVFSLTASDVAKMNPNTRTCPVFQSTKDAEIVKLAYQRFPVLFHDGDSADNDWSVRIRRVLDMNKTDVLDQCASELNGKPADWVPVCESKMVHQFNSRFGTYEGVTLTGKGVRQIPSPSAPQLSEPSHRTQPRYWIRVDDLSARLPNEFGSGWLLVWRDITSNVDFRTVISAVVPRVGTDFTLRTAAIEPRAYVATVLGLFNSFAFDFVTRQKLGGTHLSDYITYQLPVPKPEFFDKESVWSHETSVHSWTSQRVLELMYTVWDLEAFALDCGYDGPPLRWDEDRRFLLRCELDAAYFHLYLGPLAEWGTDNPELREMFPTPRDAVDYIMETFPIVKRKDIARTEIKNDAGEVTTEGTYITKDTILAIYDEMQTAIETGQPYQTRLTPPPGPPTDENGNFIPMAQWDQDSWPSHIHPPRASEVNR